MTHGQGLSSQETRAAVEDHLAVVAEGIRQVQEEMATLGGHTNREGDNLEDPLVDGHRVEDPEDRLADHREDQAGHQEAREDHLEVVGIRVLPDRLKDIRSGIPLVLR